ncbi:MAG: hypothetical protein HYX63_12240 [Gammaproteobacteria bacterium]|nr:hypothetical protein [Gammaproteobacteria bacterium]
MAHEPGSALLSAYGARRWLARYGIQSRSPTAGNRLLVHSPEAAPDLRAIVMQVAPRTAEAPKQYLIVSWFEYVAAA